MLSVGNLPLQCLDTLFECMNPADWVIDTYQIYIKDVHHTPTRSNTLHGNEALHRLDDLRSQLLGLTFKRHKSCLEVDHIPLNI